MMQAFFCCFATNGLALGGERVYVALAGEMGAALRDRINYKKAPNTVRKS